MKEKLDSGSMVDIWRYDGEHADSLTAAQSFQYAEVKGFKHLLDFVKELTQKINKPGYDNWDVMMANGTTDSIFKVFEVICDPGTTVMMEEFSFAPVFSNVRSAGGIIVPLKLEQSPDPSKQGIDVEYMSALLDNWDNGPYKGLEKPRALYTIPTGQNPTSSSLSSKKRREIYELAEKHNFLIIEDDPYGYIALHDFNKENPSQNLYKESKVTTKDYCEDLLTKSFLSLDTSGRVLRLETFSKTFIPGLRLSFIAANSYLIQRILNFAKATTGQPSGISQVVLYNVIESWASKHNGDKVEAWLNWIMKVSEEYTDRRNMMYRSLYNTSAYKKGLIRFMEGNHGMFVSLSIDIDKLGPLDGQSKLDIMDTFNYKLLEEGCLCVLGYRMAVSKEFSADRANFLRLTYSYAPDEDTIVNACERLSNAAERLFAERA